MKNKKYEIYKILQGAGIALTASSLFVGCLASGINTVVNTEQEKLFDRVERTESYVNYYNDTVESLYSSYRNGDITVEEYNKRRMAINTIEELEKNADKFMSPNSLNLYEEQKQTIEVSKEVSVNSGIGFALGVGALATSAVLRKKNKEEFDRIEEEKEI